MGSYIEIKEEYPKYLIIEMLILPSSYAIVKRVFSYTSRVKTDYQSRMSEEVFDNQMRICANKPKIENFS